MSLTYEQFINIADRQRVASDLKMALSIYYEDTAGLRWGDNADEWIEREADRLLEVAYEERDEWSDDTTQMDIDIAMGAEGWQEPYWDADGSTGLWVADPDEILEDTFEYKGTSYTIYWVPEYFMDQNGKLAAISDDPASDIIYDTCSREWRILRQDQGEWYEMTEVYSKDDITDAGDYYVEEN